MMVSIPKLNGGINMQDGTSAVVDNQLTNAKNVWFKDSVLCTRPDYTVDVYDLNEFLVTRMVTKQGVTTYIDDKLYRFGILENTDGQGMNLDLAIINLDNITVHKNFVTSNYPFVKYFIYHGTPTKGCGVYILTAFLNEHREVVFRRMFEVSKDASSLFVITPSDIYAPLVYLNGKGNRYFELPTSANAETPKASTFESLNMLYGGFRAYFKSDGLSNYYQLPYYPLTDNQGEDIKIEFIPVTGIFRTTPDGPEGDVVDVLKFTIPYSKSEKVSNESYFYDGKYNDNGTERNATGTISAKVNMQKGQIYFVFSGSMETSDGNIQVEQREFPMPTSYNAPDNIRITAYSNDYKGYDILVGMSIYEQFGGYKGLHGGSRVFVSGNPDYPSLVNWTDSNRPLYFPENNYNYVGDGNQPVTAFGKQYDMLVIFKKHEIYYTQYVEGQIINEEDIKSGAVIDVTAYSATFPVVQINSNIGCDLPATVKLCLNRLIWTNSDGQVYTLTGTYNTSERNVNKISAGIEKKLKQTDLKYAFAVDWQGHYLLVSGKEAFVLDYNRNAYKYVASQYNKTNLTWWYWEFDNNMEYGFSTDDICVFYSTYQNYFYAYTLDIDTLAECESFIETKLFDFNRPESFKNIQQVYIGVGNNNEITVAYNTDKGNVSDLPMTAQDNIIKLIPNIKGVRTFGLKVSSDKAMTIDSLTIKLKLMGGVM